jgi:hypothetical protein
VWKLFYWLPVFYGDFVLSHSGHMPEQGCYLKAALAIGSLTSNSTPLKSIQRQWRLDDQPSLEILVANEV